MFILSLIAVFSTKHCSNTIFQVLFEAIIVQSSLTMNMNEEVNRAALCVESSSVI